MATIMSTQQPPHSQDSTPWAAQLARIVRRRKIYERLQVVALLGFIGITVVPLLSWCYSRKHLDLNENYYLAAAVVAGALGWLAVARHQEQTLLSAIRQSGDVDCIGPLLEASRVRGIDQEIVVGALTRLLPRVTPSDEALLSRGQRAILFALLRPPQDPVAVLHSPLLLGVYQREEFIVAALKAIAELADREAIPVVVELAYGPLPRVAAAARACFTSLEDSLARRELASTLLRPAGPSQDLLRPAPPAATDEDTLLRAP